MAARRPSGLRGRRFFRFDHYCVIAFDRVSVGKRQSSSRRTRSSGGCMAPRLHQARVRAAKNARYLPPCPATDSHPTRQKRQRNQRSPDLFGNPPPPSKSASHPSRKIRVLKTRILPYSRPESCRSNDSDFANLTAPNSTGPSSLFLCPHPLATAVKC